LFLEEAQVTNLREEEAVVEATELHFQEEQN
jgi:hypothetical protein